MPDPHNYEGPVVLTAGGLVTRDGPTGRELLIVHRADKDEWILPKGRLHVGETPEVAALREVREESGYDASIKAYAGVLDRGYEGRDKLRVAFFWHMTPKTAEPNHPTDAKIDGTRWVAISDALDLLADALERSFVQRTL